MSGRSANDNVSLCEQANLCHRGGLPGLGPAATQPGDGICVLFGGDAPFVLRPAGDGYLVVGKSYGHGLMDGQASVLHDILAHPDRHEASRSVLEVTDPESFDFQFDMFRIQ